jgi:hypothetical protein
MAAVVAVAANSPAAARRSSFLWVRVIAHLPFVPCVGRLGQILRVIVEALRSLRPHGCTVNMRDG